MAVSAEELHALVDQPAPQDREEVAAVILDFTTGQATEISSELKELVHSRASDTDPSHWVSEDEDDARLDRLFG